MMSLREAFRGRRWSGYVGLPWGKFLAAEGVRWGICVVEDVVTGSLEAPIPRDIVSSIGL